MPDELQTGHELYVFKVTGANRHSTKVQKYDQESFLMKKKNWYVCSQKVLRFTFVIL